MLLTKHEGETFLNQLSLSARPSSAEFLACTLVPSRDGLSLEGCTSSAVTGTWLGADVGQPESLREIKALSA